MKNWIKQLYGCDQLADKKIRLICFPFAGSGASAYIHFPKYIDSRIQVCPVMLPGREERFGDKSIEDMRAMVEVLSNAVGVEKDLPFVFFGHSMGAILAYQLACYLQFGSFNVPRLLILSARGGDKFLPGSGAALERLAEHQTSKLMGLYDGKVSAEHVQQLKAIVLRTLRSDINLCCSSDYYDERKLDMPFLCLYGSDDIYVNYKDVAVWKKRTSADVSFAEVSGDHFYLVNNIEDTCQYINQVLKEMMDD